jgi:hypothetical protein
MFATAHATRGIVFRSVRRDRGRAKLLTRLSVLLLMVAVAAGCSGGDSSSQGRASVLSLRDRPPTVFPNGVLFRERGRLVGPMAIDGDSIAWVSGPLESEPLIPTVFWKQAKKGKAVQVAIGVDPGYGLAATSGWIVFARRAESGETLVASKRDRSRTIVLSDSLVGPIASRGNLVAWAEQSGGRQRVVARDMDTGQRWIAADMPVCTNGRCYRIDGVTLARRGVVFARGAIGPQPSFVVRRAFTAARPEQIVLPGDPQPDLAPSSAGALYYRLQRGWYRWDFGKAQPRATPFSHPAPTLLIGYEDGRWFLAPRTECRQRLIVQLRNGQRRLVTSPRALNRRAPNPDSPRCVELRGFTWTGKQSVAAWGLYPKEEIEEHHGSEAGLTALVVAGRLSSK